MIVTNEMEKFDYGEGHPMKPERISMTYDLLQNFDLLSQFQTFKAEWCTIQDLMVFHT